MSLDQNNAALEKLEFLQRRLRHAAERAADGSRFRCGPDRSAEFVRQVRQACHYIELAVHALELETTSEEPEHSWLSARVSGLVRYLTKSGTQDPAPTPTPPPVAPAERKNRGITGDCSSLSIPDLLAMLQGQGKTGVLRIESPSEALVLHLDRGQLVHAFSENTPSGARLGEILIAQGALDEARLESVLFCHSATPRKLGDILLEGEIVTPEELQAALSQQVQQLFHRLFVMNDAKFRFEPGLPPAGEESRARLNLIQLLLESARVNDERQAG